MSLSVHLAVLLALFGVWRARGRWTPPTRMPGTALGQREMLSYATGGPPALAAPLHQARVHPALPSLPKRALAASHPPLLPSPPTAEAGTGTSGPSALGDGDMTIALVRFHPRPELDLSNLPTGSSGEITLSAVIDANGKVKQLTVDHSLGQAIDTIVLATVYQWTFTPAMRNGTPVASEQEILFHYEHS